MKRSFIAIALFVFSGLALTPSTFAQRNVQAAQDPVLEQDARHNLDVARQAFGPARKAYKQVLMRFEETFAAYPEFAGMEEFLYLAGMSSYYLSRNEGKQKVNLKSEREQKKYAPEKLREDAVAYFAMMLERNPESRYKEEASRITNELKAVK